MSEVDLTEFTDEDFDTMTTAALRAAADALPSYSQETALLDVRLTDELFSTPGALTALDKMLTAMRDTHRSRAPRITRSYSTSVALVVWPLDEELRNSLKYEAARARKRAVEAADATT